MSWVDPKLLEILVCPVCKGPLTARREAGELVCPADRLGYPVIEGHHHRMRPAAEVVDEIERVLRDVGPQTVARLTENLRAAKTLVWNGPLGAFETPPFDRATVAAAFCL